jgi:hypothetical protein
MQATALFCQSFIHLEKITIISTSRTHGVWGNVSIKKSIILSVAVNQIKYTYIVPFDFWTESMEEYLTLTPVELPSSQDNSIAVS